MIFGLEEPGAVSDYLQSLPVMEGRVADYGERAAASFEAARITTDSMSSYTGEVESDLWGDIAEALGPSALPPEASDPGHSTYRDLQEPGILGLLHGDRLFEAARVAFARDPNAFGWIPRTREEFDAEVTRRMQASLAEQQDVLARAPEGAWGAELAGALGAGVADPVTILTLPLGAGAGGIGRVIATEAVLGAAGELATLPNQEAQAERLGIDGPDWMTQIGIAGVTSGVLGGAIAGAPRALSFGRDLTVAATDRFVAYRNPGDTPPEGTTPLTYERNIEAAGAQMEAAALAPPPPPRTYSGVTFEYAMGPRRPNPPDQPVLDVISRAVEDVLGPEATVRITSGQEGDLPQYGSIRHGTGDAADIQIVRPDGSIVQATDAEMAAIARAAAQHGALGIGFGPEYMGGQHIHIDLVPPGPGMGHTWGSTGRDMRDELVGIMNGATPPPYRPGAGGGAPRPGSGAPPADYIATSRGYTGDGQLRYGDDSRIDIAYEVIDASLLRQATGDLQPRDRSHVRSDLWVSQTAARLDPPLLMFSPTADRGAPVVGPDNIIESGNGRILAIRRAYAEHPDRAMAYREALARAGYSTEGMAEPVLIARRKTDFTPDQRRDFVVQAQDSGVAEMTAAERARVGRQALTAETMGLHRPGARLSDAQNRDFARRFVGAFPPSQQGRLIADDKSLSTDGIRELRDAIFARAWNDDDLLRRFIEEDAGDLKTLMDALSIAAPDFARLRAMIEAGNVRPEMDISPFVLDAARLIMAGRDIAARDGRNAAAMIEELLAEIDMLDGAIAPLTQALVRHFMPNGRQAPADRIGAFLSRYAREAMEAGRPGGVFADPPGPLDVLKRIEPEAFGHLTETGLARARPEPAAITTDPEALRGFDDGAASPAAVAADDLMLAEARALAQAAPARPDPDNPALRDTRGTGIRLHGARGGPLPERLSEGAYSDLNYYGQGFYTTDAAAIAKGYDRGGGIYEIEEVAEIRPFDMEQPVPDFVRRLAEDEDVYGSGLLSDALGEAPANLRELYDEIRAASRAHDMNADEVQELFDILRFAFEREGFNAFDHVGGLRTKKAPHQVRIYFNPHTDVRAIPADASDFSATAFVDDQGQIARQLRTSNEPTASVPSRIPDTTAQNVSTASDPEIQPPAADDAVPALTRPDRNLIADGDFPVEFDADGNPTRMASEALDDIEADADLMAAIEACTMRSIS